MIEAARVPASRPLAGDAAGVPPCAVVLPRGRVKTSSVCGPGLLAAALAGADQWAPCSQIAPSREIGRGLLGRPRRLVAVARVVVGGRLGPRGLAPGPAHSARAPPPPLPLGGRALLSWGWPGRRRSAAAGASGPRCGWLVRLVLLLGRSLAWSPRPLSPSPCGGGGTVSGMRAHTT